MLKFFLYHFVVILLAFPLRSKYLDTGGRFKILPTRRAVVIEETRVYKRFIYFYTDEVRIRIIPPVTLDRDRLSAPVSLSL